MDQATNSLPFNKNDLLPKDRLDRGLFISMTFIIPCLALWEISILFRYHATFDLVVILHLIAEMFIFVNIIGNLYYLKRIDASGKQKSLPALLRPGWRYCHFCELNSPPRSYHCPICDECILKRDRHCMFAGCCIGFYNQRYYLLAVIYVWLGATYSFFYQSEYVIETLGGLHWSTALKILAPHMALITGFLSFYSFILIVTELILFLSMGLTTFLMIQQFVCIYNGQTSHEREERITIYNLSLKRNFEQVLGKNWLLAILSPFFASPIDGDGLYFVTLDELTDIKDV